jgi:hypothetical protein
MAALLATKPDVFSLERPMFFYERFLFVSGRATWNVFFALRMHGPLDADALRLALATLQDRHPALRAGIEMRDGRPWFVTAPAPPPIPLVISIRHGDDTWLSEAWRARRRPFALPDGPFAEMLWIRSANGIEGPEELVLVLHHCICDGASALMVMREFLVALGTGIGQIDAHPALMSVEALQPDRPRPTRRRRWRDDAVVAASRLLLPATRLLRHPAFGADTMIRWQIDQPTLAALDRTCRQERATMTFVLSAAILLAFRDVRGPAARNRLLCPVDLRPLLPAIGRDRLFPIADAIPLSLEAAATNLWDHAKRLREQLVESRARLDPGRRLELAERLHAVADRVVELQRFGRVKQDAVISVLPPLNLPSGDGPNALLDVLGAFGVIPWRDATGVYVFRNAGRMTFMFVSREDLLTCDEAVRIGDRVIQILSDAAGHTSVNKSVVCFT